MSQVDPLTLAVVQGALETTIRQMTIALRRTARSPIFVIGHDLSNCLFDWAPRMIAQGEDQPVHLGAMLVSMKTVAEYFDQVYPGDIIYHNDPETGGAHLPDMTVYKPIYFDGDLMFWAANRGHVNETGGPVPGGENPEAEEIYAEGLRIPPVKIYERGEIRRDVVNLILSNVRTKQEAWGDMGAQIAAVNTAERRLVALVEKYGKSTIKQSIEILLDRAERMMRAQIAAMPDGEYHGQALIEDDGHGSGDMVIKSTVVINDDEMLVRLHAPPQTRSYVNSYSANTLSGVYAGVLLAVSPDLPHNEGIYRPIKVDFGPEGTVLNAVLPAACSASTHYTGEMVIEVVTDALNKAVPNRACAGSSGWYAYILSGVDPRTGEVYNYMSHMCGLGGGGAGWKTDGWHVLGLRQIAGASMTGDIELVEYRVPIHIHRYELETDTACPGKWRGGFGSVYEVEIVDHDAMVTNVGEGSRYPPPSALGAEPQFALDKKKSRHYLVKGKEPIEMPANSRFKAVAGDRVLSFQQGGGGVGPAYERDPKLVHWDVRNGFVSLESARVDYGVVIEPQTLEIDYEATNTLRSKAPSRESSDDSDSTPSESVGTEI